MFVKLKVFFTEDTNHIHLSGAFHISWLLGRLLFLERWIPPSYSIQCFSTCPLYFASYSSNFVRDRDIIPSRNEWVNNTASADLVPSQFNFAEVEKRLKRKLSEGHRKRNKFSKSKNASKQDFCKLEGRESQLVLGWSKEESFTWELPQWSGIGRWEGVLQISGKKRMRSITIIHGSPIKAKKL